MLYEHVPVQKSCYERLVKLRRLIQADLNRNINFTEFQEMLLDTYLKQNKITL